MFEKLTGIWAGAADRKSVQAVVLILDAGIVFLSLFYKYSLAQMSVFCVLALFQTQMFMKQLKTVGHIIDSRNKSVKIIALGVDLLLLIFSIIYLEKPALFWLSTAAFEAQLAIVLLYRPNFDEKNL